MRKAALVTAALWIAMSACSGEPDGTSARSGSQKDAASSFTAQGTAVAASPEQIEKLGKVAESVRGLAGSITLRPSSLGHSSKGCLIEGEESIVILYTIGTKFEPAEASRNTLGHKLSISGTVMDEGSDCRPVASRVVDEGLDPGAQPPPSAQREAGSGTATRSQSGKRAKGPAPKNGGTAKAASPGSASPPEQPPADPEVISTFRPSLPDPPS